MMDQVDELETRIFPAKESHTKTLFFFHGLGSKVELFNDIFSALQNSRPNLKIIAHQAPNQPAPMALGKIKQGDVVPSWFNGEPNYFKSIMKILIRDIVKELETGITSKDIYHAGYSQGSAVANELIKGTDWCFGGVLLFGSFNSIANTKVANYKMNENKRHMQIVLFTGTKDVVAKPEGADELKEKLQSFGCTNVINKKYKKDHSQICFDQIKDQNLKKTVLGVLDSVNVDTDEYATNVNESDTNENGDDTDEKKCCILM